MSVNGPETENELCQLHTGLVTLPSLSDRLAVSVPPGCGEPEMDTTPGVSDAWAPAGPAGIALSSTAVATTPHHGKTALRDLIGDSTLSPSFPDTRFMDAIYLFREFGDSTLSPLFPDTRFMDTIYQGVQCCFWVWGCSSAPVPEPGPSARSKMSAFLHWARHHITTGDTRQSCIAAPGSMGCDGPPATTGTPVAADASRQCRPLR